MQLPLEYKRELENLFSDEREYRRFLSCYEEPPYRGIRINTLKICEERFKEIFKFKIKKSPFSKDSYYLEDDVNSIGNLPLHHAGAFYVQEPSASSAVTALDPQPYEKILDLCAAPGGKSTQIAASLRGHGFLWSNEIVGSRARVLLSNIEQMGVRNAVVSSCTPEVLCEKLCGFFDKVLVDAPCSGEGMFRKNPEAIMEWSPEHVKACAKRQLAILRTAAKALKKDGVLVYSTCTFSLEENEGGVYNFLKENADFALEDIDAQFGRASFNVGLSGNLIDTSRARRIFPQDGGEGHFVAKMRKIGDGAKKVRSFDYKTAKNTDNKLGREIFSQLFNCDVYGKIAKVADKFVILPEGLLDLSGLGVLRAGVLLATSKGSVWEPAHAAFMAASKEELKFSVDLSSDSGEILDYLRGHEISIDDKLSGYIGVCVDGIVAGFGKAVNGRLKNKYPKGLRILS